MRFLVARMDGTPESGFAPGAIKAAKNVPVMRNFDWFQIIGRADIEVDGENVYARFSTLDLDVSGHLYPAIGGRAFDAPFPQPTGDVHDNFEVFTVSLCDGPNVDPQIPCLSGNFFEETR